jgi:hypothetical protein
MHDILGGERTAGPPDNLFEPGRDLRGTHRRFDPRSTDRSLALWMTEHRNRVMLALTLLGLSALVYRARTASASLRHVPRYLLKSWSE